MNYGILQADDTALFLGAADAIDFQPACGLGMDRALGTVQASHASVVRLNPCALYRNTLWHSPVLRELLDAGCRAFAFSWELQMHWVKLIAPQRPLMASNCSRHAQPTAEVLERSMDIAIGVRAA